MDAAARRTALMLPGVMQTGPAPLRDFLGCDTRVVYDTMCVCMVSVSMCVCASLSRYLSLSLSLSVCVCARACLCVFARAFTVFNFYCFSLTVCVVHYRVCIHRVVCSFGCVFYGSHGCVSGAKHIESVAPRDCAPQAA